MKQLVKFVVVLMLLVAAPVAANAQKAEDDWNFSLGTFLWAAGVKTTLNTPDISVSGKADFFDILENSTPSVNLTFAAQKEKLGLHVNLFNLHLQNDIPTLTGNSERSTSLDLYIPEAFAGYEVLNTDLSDTVKLQVSPYAGVRYFNTRIIIDRLGGGEWRDVHGALTDGIFGALGTVSFGEKLSVTLRGDAGGFGWGGDSNDEDYFGLATLNWRYAKNRTIRVGYAYLRFSKDNLGRSGDADLEIKSDGPIFSHSFQF